MLILTPSNVVFTLPSNDTSLSTWLPYMHVYILGHEALSFENITARQRRPETEANNLTS